jgi:hypothetical protein
MKAMKVELLILDFDGLGEEEVKQVLENARYPNRCISPDVKGIKSVEIEWSDDHPLNKYATCERAYRDLFDGA